MDSLQSLTNELAQAQKRLGISDIALASATGVSRQTISRIVGGQSNFSVNTLLSLADTLGLTVMLVPKDAAQAFQVHSRYSEVRDQPAVAGVVDQIKDL